MDKVTKSKIIIVGAGPAGIQLTYFLEKAGHDYILIECGDKPASFFRKYPRHRKLISINKAHTGKSDEEYNLRHDWNSLISDDPSMRLTHYTKDYFPSAERFLDYINDFVSRNALNITYGTRVESISKNENDSVFELKTNFNDTYICDHLVMATGVERPYVPDIPGIEYAVGYEDVSIKQEDFTNKSVLIIGKGNSAFETADHLIENASIIHVASPNSIKFAWDTRFPGHLRAVNNNFLDTYSLKSQNALIDATILKIWKNKKSGKTVVRFHLAHAKEEVEQIEYDVVIRCTGFQFNKAIFADDTLPEMRHCGKLPMMQPNFESTNIKNLFFAGTIMQMLDYKQTQSSFVHGFRYNVRSLFYFLEERAFSKSLPIVQLNTQPTEIVTEIIKHLNSVSSLWQQVGFLTDVLQVDGDRISWYRDLPYNYVMENKKRFGHSFFTVMFRLKPCPGETFSHSRSSDVYEGDSSVASHPVVERYKNGECVDVFHVLEDLFADWSGKEYVDPLIEFFTAALSDMLFKPSQIKRATHSSEEGLQLVRNIVRDENMHLKSSVIKVAEYTDKSPIKEVIA